MFQSIKLCTLSRCRKAAVFALSVCSGLFTQSALAQTVIYDGSQDLNFFSSSFLTDDLMLNNNPSEPTRNGIVQSGSDPNVLEVGDAAWFRSTGRRMRTNVTVGAAAAAAGVDGAFMSSHFDTSNTPPQPQSNDQAGVGAGYVLYDAGTTTGNQVLNLSLFYDDPTVNGPPIDEEGTVDPNNFTGASVAIRILGIQASSDATDPWRDDRFQFLAGNANAGARVAAANHQAQGDNGDEPVIDRLALHGSSYADGEVVIEPSADWQDISVPFDAGTGYDYLLFALGGVIHDSGRVGVDHFAFDNVSFEAAPFDPGDFDQDGDVDGADFLEWQRTDQTTTGLDDWRAGYNPLTVQSAAQVVPEPSSVLLVTMGLILLAQKRK